MAKPDDPPFITAQDIERMRSHAADPGEFRSLQEHSVSQDGQSAVLSEQVIELAKETSVMLSSRSRRRRTRSGQRVEEPRHPDADPDSRSGSPPPGVMASEAIEELMVLLDVPEQAYELGPHTFRLLMHPDEAAGYPPLPPGYGYKGGVARKALARTLRLPISTAAVRDIDLLRSDQVGNDHDRASWPNVT